MAWRDALPLALFLAAILSSQSLLVDAGDVTYNLNVTIGFWSPDCVQKQVYLINGQYPGPTLNATEGDTVTVYVTNMMALEGLSIHWHGIRQINTNLMDGGSQITQCGIQPFETFAYTFVVDKAGTYMYHSHHGQQSSGGLYGKFIVYDKDPAALPFKYDDELAVILNDWWHRTVIEQTAGLDSIPFGWIGDPQSLLLNGKGQYNCSLIPSNFTAATGDVKTCNASSPQCGREVFTVQAGKTYRFRIASIAALNALAFAVKDHPLIVVAADGYLVKPFKLKSLDVYSGQTVDVLLRANQPPGNYWIRSAVFGRKPTTPFGLAILNYEGVPIADPTEEPYPVKNWTSVANSWHQAHRYKALTTSEGGDTPSPPSTRDRELVLLGTQNKIEGRIKWAMNNISHMEPATPFTLGFNASLQDQLYSLAPDYPPTPYDYTQPPVNPNATMASSYYLLQYNSTVDIVLQNANTLTPNNSEYHPWHMHGHQFWVLGYGAGTYDPATSNSTFNLLDPVYRNTVVVMPYSWTAIRMKADNPGAWNFHCHVTAHQHLGMRVILVNSQSVPIPQNFHKCGSVY